MPVSLKDTTEEKILANHFRIEDHQVTEASQLREIEHTALGLEEVEEVEQL